MHRMTCNQPEVGSLLQGRRAGNAMMRLLGWLRVRASGCNAAMAAALTCIILTTGCSARHCHPAPQKPACYPSGPCAGYFPTCWRMWPEECPSCPVYGLDEVALPGQPMETVPLPPTGVEVIGPSRGAQPEEAPMLPPGDAAPGQGKPGDRGPRLEDRGSSTPSVKKRAISAGPPGRTPEWQMPPLPGDARVRSASHIGKTDSQFISTRRTAAPAQSQQRAPMINDARH